MRKLAKTLGLSMRAVAYYSIGKRPVSGPVSRLMRIMSNISKGLPPLHQTGIEVATPAEHKRELRKK